jgi:DNA mismatch repair protein MutS2
MQADFQSLLSRLHNELEQNERLNAQLREERASLESERRALQQAAARREEKQTREWERKREELIADFEARALETIGQAVSQLEGKKAADQAKLQVARAKREFREQAAKTMTPNASSTAAAQPLTVAEGVKVRLRDVSQPATVRRILKNGAIEVEAGFLKMQVLPEDVVEVLSSAESNKLPRNVTLESGPRWDVSYKEINLIGRRAEEAVEELDKFLDSAALASVNRVRIVHGHGMGVLKRAVGEFLSRSPHIARFYPASQAEGGSGATIAELRE